MTGENEARPDTIAGAWLAVALWSGLVWWLGSGAFSESETSRFIGPLVAWLWPAASPEQAAAAVAFLRKLAHPIEYGVLAALAFHAVHVSGVAPALRAGLVALTIATGVAALDESRQAQVASRTGSAADVALDALGAATALAGVAAVARLRRSPALEGARGV